MEFFDALVRYETNLWNLLDRELLDARGRSLAVLEALRVVDRHPGACRVNEISDDLRITVGAASKLVDRLERDELARRMPHPSDRRSTFVDLTPLGRDELKLGLRVVEAALAAHLSETVADTGLLAAQLRSLDTRIDQRSHRKLA